MATAELETVAPILESLRGRRPDGRWGIGTAGSYLDATPPNLFGVSPAEWQEAMEKAANTLTYSEQGATIESLPWSVLGEDGRDRLSRNMELLPVKRTAKPAGLDGFVLVFDYTLTTVDEDRDFDILEPKGATVDMLGPLLFNHVSVQPIGRLVKLLKQNSKRLAEQSAIMDFPFGRDVAQMIEFQVLRRMSHGFLPTKYEERRSKKEEEDVPLGWHILEYEIMERSVVSVASNRGAIIEAWNLLGEKGFHDNRVKGWFKSVYEARPVIGRGFTPDSSDCDQTPPTDPAREAEPQSVRWPSSKSASSTVSKGTVPGDPPGGSGEGAEGEWSKLRLSDFTDENWGDLSAAEKGKIKRYFAWHAGTVETFDDLKLGHHFPPGGENAGKASLNGVRNALARANQVDGIGDDLERVMEHLRAHLPKKGSGVRSQESGDRGQEEPIGKGPKVTFAWLAAAATEEELRQAKTLIDARLREKRNRRWRRLLGLE